MYQELILQLPINKNMSKHCKRKDFKTKKFDKSTIFSKKERDTYCIYTHKHVHILVHSIINSVPPPQRD